MILKLKSVIFFLSIILCGMFFASGSAQAQTEAKEIMADNTQFTETYLRGRVTEILHTETDTDLGEGFVTQKVRVTAGKEPEIFLAEYSFHTSGGDKRLLKAGDRVVLIKTVSQLGTTYSISDVYRLNGLWVITTLFFVLAVIFAGKRGLFAFLGLGFTILVLMWYMVPRFSAGAEPLRVAGIGVFIIVTVSLYIAHGWRRRTHIAFASTIISIVIACALSALCVYWLRLFGGGSEAAFYLQSSEKPLNIQGLLLAGIILGALGVLDDITTAQAAAVEEIHLANPILSGKEIYKRGLSVGREHISSLVNTLVLAYAGASLPLLLLFYIYPRPLWVTLNSELMMEEVVRTLVGSITLIIAVPLTTLCATFWIIKKHKTL